MQQGRCASAALLLQASVCVGLQPCAWGFSAVHSAGVVVPPFSPSALPSHRTSRPPSLWCCCMEVDSAVLINRRIFACACFELSEHAQLPPRSPS